jgi:hypothetical protein
MQSCEMMLNVLQSYSIIQSTGWWHKTLYESELSVIEHDIRINLTL